MGHTACTEPQCLHKGALYLLTFYLSARHYMKQYSQWNAWCDCRRPDGECHRVRKTKACQDVSESAATCKVKQKLQIPQIPQWKFRNEKLRGYAAISTFIVIQAVPMHAINAYGRVAVQLHTFLTAAISQLHAEGTAWVLSEYKVI